MKCLVFIILISPVFANWEMIGPYGGPLYPIILATPDENIAYCATFNRPPSIVYRSQDQGSSWERRGRAGDYLFSLAVNPTDPDRLYGGSSGKIYRSTDGGATWDSAAVGDYYIYGIYVRPDNPNDVYAIGAEQIGSYHYMAFYRSTNGGSTWTTRVINDVDWGLTYALAVDPSDPDNLYVGGYIYTTTPTPKMYHSTDGGNNFIDVSNGLSTGDYVRAAAVHPTNSNIVYAVTNPGNIYRTTDAGSSWELVYTGSITTSIATSISSPAIVYAGADTVVYKSTDAGLTWFIAGTGLGATKYRQLAVSQNNSDIVLTGDVTGCSRTTDGGTNWVESNYGLNVGMITSFGSSPLKPATIFTEFEGVAIYKTTDNGTNWEKLPTPLECGNICAFAFHNNNPDIVLALAGKG